MVNTYIKVEFNVCYYFSGMCPEPFSLEPIVLRKFVMICDDHRDNANTCPDSEPSRVVGYFKVCCETRGYL